MDEIRKFQEEIQRNLERQGADLDLKALTRFWIKGISPYKYVYNFSWLGRPVIQFPQDIMAMQEIVWKVKPRLIIETGIAHGGSLIFYASLLELLGNDGLALGIDIDIRAHNRTEIENHPMYKRIRMIEGSSVGHDIVEKVYEIAEGRAPIIVVLDSYHTHDHVLSELKAYSPLVKKGGYIIVFDTLVEDLPGDIQDRPWGKGNNPKTAVWEFLRTDDRFKVDYEVENKLLITSAPGGYLKCIKD